MACPNVEKIDPRVLRTRKLLQEALGSLMREGEYAAISVQDITERATVNRATFYAHYPDKQALLESVVQTMFQEFVSSRFSEAPEMTASTLAAMFAAVIEFVYKMLHDCPKSAKAVSGVIDSALRDEVFALFRQWLASEPNPFEGHKSEMVALVLSTSVLSAARHWGREKGRANPERLAKALVAMLVPGHDSKMLAGVGGVRAVS